MTEYVVHTQDTTLRCSHVQSDPSDINNRTRGGSATFTLSIKPREPLSVASGESHTVPSGQTEVYETAEINGTLTINGTLVVYGTFDNNGTVDNNGKLTLKDARLNRLAELLAYDRHAGSYTLTETLGNVQRYKERLPTNPNINSLVVGLEPATDLSDRDIAGKWGLISNITDNRTRALTNPVITLEIDILADYNEYSDVTDVQNNLAI